MDNPMQATAEEDAATRIARLTRERDEAVQALRTSRALSAQAQRERDEARAEVEGLRTCCTIEAMQANVNVNDYITRGEAERDRLRALLWEVEWAGDGVEAENRGCCLWCLAHNGDGHELECKLAAALEGRDG